MASFRGEDSDGPEAAVVELTEVSSLEESKVVVLACTTSDAGGQSNGRGGRPPGVYVRV
jgi:hypothetical protein